MRNETFYATMGQVLPTLLIAFAVEFHLWVREVLEDPRGIGYARRTRELSRNALNDALLIMRVVGWAFFIGEVTALLTLFVGTRGWWPWAAAPAVGLCTLILLLVVIGAPLNRLISIRRSMAE